MNNEQVVSIILAAILSWRLDVLYLLSCCCFVFARPSLLGRPLVSGRSWANCSRSLASGQSIFHALQELDVGAILLSAQLVFASIGTGQLRMMVSLEDVNV